MFTAVFREVDGLDDEGIAVDVGELKHRRGIHSGVGVVQNLFPIGGKLRKTEV